MRNKGTAMLAVCVMVCVLNWTAMAAEEAPAVAAVSEGPSLGVSVSTAFMSKYIWRGQLLSDDYAFQPSVGVTYGGWSASLWGNMALTDYRLDHELYEKASAGEFSEYDWTIGYADKIPGSDLLKYSFGAIYYYFPSMTDDGDTMEVYAGMGLDTVLSPTVTVYRDVDEADGTYAAFSVSHSIEKICELSSDMPVGMSASASIGWGSDSYNKYYWASSEADSKSVTSSSMQDLTLSVSFPVPVLGWTLTPSINYVTLLDSEVRESNSYATYSGNDDSDYVFTGLTLSRSF